jgi:hypothetical protein
VLHGLAATHGDGDDLVALIDSSGYLEVACLTVARRNCWTRIWRRR